MEFNVSSVHSQPNLRQSMAASSSRSDLFKASSGDMCNDAEGEEEEEWGEENEGGNCRWRRI